MAFVMESGKVYVCHHLMRRAGNWAHYQTDLTLIDGKPYLVLEWEKRPGLGEVPKIIQPVNANELHPLPGWKGVDCMLEGQGFDDPTPFN